MKISSRQQKMLWREADRFVVSFQKVNEAALKGVEEMLKHPVSLEQARKQTYQIQAKIKH